MKLKWLAFLCLGVAAFVSTASAQEKTTDEVIKVKTALVSVPVIVSDRDGRYIPDLKQEEFNILQDGVSQKIEFFATVAEPINVALLIDTSQSTRDVLGSIKKSATNFIKLLQPTDRAMVVNFDYETHILSPLTLNQEQLKDAIHMAEIPDREVGTTLRDAVAETVKKQFAGVTGRKAIILMTDGKDHGSYVSTADLIHSLEESDVIVYTVYFKTGEGGMRRPNFGGMGGMGGRGGGGMGRGGRNSRFPGGDRPQNPRRHERAERQNEDAKEFLQKLSDTTAGRFYESKASNFKEVFELVVDELRHQYRLGYYPPEEAQNATFHAIKVKVIRPNLVVRARSSYRPNIK